MSVKINSKLVMPLMMHEVIDKSTCDRGKIGAIMISKTNQVLGIGYPDSPKNMPTCGEIGHLIVDGHCVRTIHAEENCILHTFELGRPITKNDVMYISAMPCIHCANIIVNAGVKHIRVADDIWQNKNVRNIFDDANIDVELGHDGSYDDNNLEVK